MVHVHTSAGAASDIDQIGQLVDQYGDDVKIHLVHIGGGVSGHIKLISQRFFDWIEAGKQVYTDTSLGDRFRSSLAGQRDRAPRIGQDRVLFASDEPWGDYAGELARLQAATGDGELGRMSCATTSRPSTADQARGQRDDGWKASCAGGMRLDTRRWRSSLKG